MKPETLIFDAEGVVLDTEGAWDVAQKRFLAEHGHTYARDRVKHLLTGRSLQEGAAILKELYGLEGSVEELSDQRLAAMRDILDGEVRFIPGFLEFFRAVRREYNTCLATAMDERLLAVARRSLDLDELFGKRIFTLTDVDQRSKPDPALFLHAARTLQSPPERCIVLEDSPLGIEAAKAAGMRAVGMATTYPPEKLQRADIVVTSYRELRLDELPDPLRREAPRAVALGG